MRAAQHVGTVVQGGAEALAMIRPRLSGRRTPARERCLIWFRRNRSVWAWLPYSAPNNCCCSGAGRLGLVSRGQALLAAPPRSAFRRAPFEDALDRLDSIPGVGRRTAEVLVAEIGLDMRRFPTASHLASWAGMCPGNNESAANARMVRPARGNAWLRTALIEAAHASSRARHTDLAAQYHRLISRRGKKKAVVVVGHTILTIAYQLLTDGVHYADLGATYFQERDQEHVTRRLVNRLETLGYSVQLQPYAA